jgi:arsenate reductase-like glutaredoxin family protein
LKLPRIRSNRRYGVGADIATAGRAHHGEWIDVLAANPQLIQRPLVVTDDGTAYVARDSDTVNAVVKQASRQS